MLISRSALKAEMARKNITQRNLSKILNLSTASVNRKLIGSSQFSEDQIVVLYKTFGNAIFFNFSCYQNDNI